MPVTEAEAQEMLSLAKQAPLHIRGSASMDPEFDLVADALALTEKKWAPHPAVDYSKRKNVDYLLRRLRDICARPQLWPRRA